MGVVLGLCDSKLFICSSTWVQFYAKPLALSWLAQILNAVSCEKRENPSRLPFITWGILLYFLTILTFLRQFIKASRERDECCLFPCPLVTAAAYPKSLSGSFFKTTPNNKQTF